ncbi:hypothetical protein LQ327_31545 [Actinomycetospora endophytica]|uniref:Zinc-binding alcohol dehydrogenase family protein n=1 Tax=Actinomycetospora endophytica TaxID=2291215 RepID=A0ABS8PIC0_9PSEU|nr:hypothetical protein [Actinomycetospora endophytica]MCD2197914.1 hypothetical protein [Actinomycetospora endophytica]
MRTNIGDELPDGALADVAKLAAAGHLTVPIARTFALEEYLTTFEMSASNRAGRKVLLIRSRVRHLALTSETMLGSAPRDRVEPNGLYVSPRG